MTIIGKLKIWAKRIKRDLPKLTEHLIEKLAEWNENHESDFQFKGEIYLDVIARQEDEIVAVERVIEAVRIPVGDLAAVLIGPDSPSSLGIVPSCSTWRRICDHSSSL